MDTVLEQQRRFHEEKERLIQSIVNDALEKRSTVKEQINSDHRIKIMQTRYMSVSNELRELYEDRDSSRKEEIRVMSGPKAFGQFYSRLKSIKDFYKSHPTEIAIPMSVEFENLQQNLEDPINNMIKFTDEEGHGKYLDLHQAFERYLNIKGIEPIDYVTYLTNFDKLFDVPNDKKGGEYKRYLQFLLHYFTEFSSRVYPLLDVKEEMNQVLERFTTEWNEGTFPGWPKEDLGEPAVNEEAQLPIDLDSYSSLEELASLGLDRLKQALKSMGLKCGGTLEERAKRLFDSKGKRLDQLPASYLAKERSLTGKQLEYLRKKEVASLEAKVYYFSELFGEQKMSTKENVQRKQAMASGEIERELSDDEEIDLQNSDDDLGDNDDDIPYNPKNLPLDWDGKPIPYWLYKLHGLNINYNCEICGNQVYRGPKAFQRHFSEWRHAHGMRCLGIPNTAHFANVTLIEDAVALWEKLKIQKNIERWKPEVEEEFEDTEGNVVNRRTYEDLKRQDLL